jgi:hypothetical protein
MTLTPAYGRDYTTKRAVLADWHANKDFIVADLFSPWDGKPVNQQDIANTAETEVQIRYKRLEKIAVVQIAFQAPSNSRP